MRSGKVLDVVGGRFHLHFCIWFIPTRIKVLRSNFQYGFELNAVRISVFGAVKEDLIYSLNFLSKLILNQSLFQFQLTNY